MLTENEGLDNTHNILFILRIIVLEFLEHASFDQALLIQTFLVAEDLEGDYLLLLVVEALKDLAERALADALLHLKAVSDVVMHLADVLSFVVIEASVFRPIRCGQRFCIIFTFEDV